LILAVPVAPPDTVASMQDEVDELICPLTPSGFRAVGMWYDDFSQTTDQQVVDLLKKHRARQTETHESQEYC
jgi:predicted phosphoribosyltransferase